MPRVGETPVPVQIAEVDQARAAMLAALDRLDDTEADDVNTYTNHRIDVQAGSEVVGHPLVHQVSHRQEALDNARERVTRCGVNWEQVLKTAGVEAVRVLEPEGRSDVARLYDEKYLSVLNYIRFGLGYNRETAEDLAHDTFFRAAKHIAAHPQFLSTMTEERAKRETGWLFRIAINRHRDLYRRTVIGRPTKQLAHLCPL